MGRRTLLSVALALVASACAGPRAPLDVGIKEFPTDILLGTQSTSPPLGPIVAPVPVPVSPPTRFLPPTSPPPPPPPACPKAHPFDAPKRELRSAAIVPPAPAAYPFRTTGVLEAGPIKAQLPKEVEHRIEAVTVETSGAFTFDVASDLTRTTYRVVPKASGVQEAGVFMTRQLLGIPTQQIDLRPVPPLKLLPFPVDNGAKWDSVATDAATQTTWVIHGEVGVLSPDPSDPKTQVLNPTIRVDACGEWVEGWAVRITGPNGQGAARIFSPTMNMEFTATYAFGTQYGSLSLFDETSLKGTISSTAFTYAKKASIKREPVFPGAA